MTTNNAARQYDCAAASYDRLWRGYVRATTDLIEAHARVRPGERVLDLGCGTGVIEERLAARNPEQQITGVDVSPGMLTVAREKLAGAPNVRFTEASAEALPLSSASVDVVVSASALHYLARPGTALAEARRVLRPGGRLVVLDWDRSRFPVGIVDAFLNLADPAHARTLTLDELSCAITEVGFDVRYARSYRRGVWGLSVVVAYA